MYGSFAKSHAGEFCVSVSKGAMPAKSVASASKQGQQKAYSILEVCKRTCNCHMTFESCTN